MAKKKKARVAKRTKAVARKTTRRVARKKIAKPKVKVKAKAAHRKAAPPLKKTKKRVVRKPVAAKAAVRKAVARPQLPRRVPQAVPPPPAPPAFVMPPPVVDVEPIAPPPPPPLADYGESSDEAAEDDGGPQAAGVGGRVPGVGDTAPDFDLPDQTGRRHSLAQYRGRQVVLYFYPKDDTPGCTVEACAFRDALGSFDARGATVLAVSGDSVVSHERFAQKFSLTFPLLADEGHQAAQRYGVWIKKVSYGRTRMGIARTTFVIDPEGHIAQVFRSVRPQGHADEVLQGL